MCAKIEEYQNNTLGGIQEQTDRHTNAHHVKSQQLKKKIKIIVFSLYLTQKNKNQMQIFSERMTM